MAKIKTESGEAPGYIPLKFVKAGEIEYDEKVSHIPEAIPERDLKPANVISGHDFMLQKYQMNEEFSDASDDEINYPKRIRKRYPGTAGKWAQGKPAKTPASHQLIIAFRGKGKPKPEAYEIKELHPKIQSVAFPRGRRYCFVTFPNEEAANEAYVALSFKQLNGYMLRVCHRKEKSANQGFKLFRDPDDLNIIFRKKYVEKKLEELSEKRGTTLECKQKTTENVKVGNMHGAGNVTAGCSVDKS